MQDLGQKKRVHFGIKNSEEASIRAKENWKKLAAYVRNMKNEANWLVIELDNKEHAAHENMNGMD